MPDTQPTTGDATAERQRQEKKDERKREAKLLNEFTAQKEQAGLFNVEGFADSSKQAELRRYLDQRNKLVEKLVESKEPKVRENAAEDLEIVNKKVEKLAQEARQEAQEDNQPPIDADGIRLLIDRAIPSTLKEFVQKNCKFIYDPAQESDSIEVRRTDKIEFIFGKKALVSQTQTTLENGQRIAFFDTTKLIFQIRRMVGALLAPPTNWEQHKNNIKQITRHGGKPLPPTWEDFVALYITDQEQAKDMSPDAAGYLDKLIQSPGLRVQEIRERLAGVKKFGDDELAPSKRTDIRERYDKAKLAFRFFFRTLIPISYTDWVERFVAEFEDKEASRILKRDEHVTLRDQRLAIYFAAGDKLSARTYLLTVSSTSDKRDLREHYYLHTFDSLYRASGGQQITKESYDFIMRLHRISNRERRHATKPAEYAPAIQPDGSVVYKRLSREQYEEYTFDEVEKKTARELNQVAQEMYEWMVRIGGGHFEIDEKFGARNAPFGMNQEDWKKKSWLYEHNDLRETYGTEKTLGVFQFAEGKDGWHKLDTDQLIIMARWVAGIEMSRGIGPHGRPIDPHKISRGENPFTEHSRLALSEAYNHYAHKLAEYRSARAEGREPIPEYERFIHYIERFKEKVWAHVDTAGKLSEQEHEAKLIAENEPVPALSRAPEETLDKLKKIEAVLEDSGSGDKKKPGLKSKLKEDFDLVSKNIPLAFRNFLRKDLTRLRELLRHPDELDDVVAKIYNLEQFLDDPNISDERKAQFQAEQSQYRAGCHEALVALRPFYLQNRAGIDALEALSNWRDNFAPYRKKIAEVNNKEALSTELSATQQKIDQLFKKPHFDERSNRFVFETYQPIGVIERQVTSLQFLPDQEEVQNTEIYQQLDKRLDEPGQNRELKEEDKPRWYYFQLKAYELALKERIGDLRRKEQEQQAQAA